MKEIEWKPDMTDAEYATYKATCLYLGIEVKPQYELTQAEKAVHWYKSNGIKAFIVHDDRRLVGITIETVDKSIQIGVSEEEINFRAYLYDHKIGI